MIRLRRTIISSLMALSIVTAAPAHAADVSPQMQALVTNFTRLSVTLRSIDREAAPEAWRSAAADRSPVLATLILQKPASAMDLAAKMAALVEFVDRDSEYYAIRLLVDDALALAEAAK